MSPQELLRSEERLFILLCLIGGLLVLEPILNRFVAARIFLHIFLTAIFIYMVYMKIAVRRNDADFRLVADRVISDLYRSKKILEIYDKWIGKFTRKMPPLFDAMIRLNATPE